MNSALPTRRGAMSSGLSAPKRRICILCSQSPSDMGGIQTIVRDLVKLYSGSGYEVHICTAAKRDNVKGFEHVHSYYHLTRSLSPFLWPLNIAYVAALVGYLTFLHTRLQFTVIVPQDNYVEGLAGAIAGRLARCPVVVMDHGVATNIADKRWQDAWKERHGEGFERALRPLFSLGVLFQRVIFRTTCRLADRFFYTGYELDDFYDHYRVEAGRRLKYEHLIDAVFFSPSETAGEVDRLRDEFGIPRDHFVINCTSRINFEKGYREIVAALDQLVAAVGRNVTLAIAGDDGQVHQTKYRANEEKRGLIEFLESRDLMQNVRLLGVLEPRSVRDLNRASDIHLYAGTMSCSFSLCVLEAMSCGVACVVTPVPRKQGDVITPELGWVVPPGEVAPMARALIDACRRRGDLAAMGRKAREHVLTYNTYAAMRETYENAIRF